MLRRNDAVRVVEVWRQKQLEFTFRLTTMERYEDFEQVTRKALDYALALVGQQLNADQKNVLMAQYNDLERFPDVEANRQVNAVWMGSRRDTRLCQTPTRAPARGRPGSLHDKSANAFT